MALPEPYYDRDGITIYHGDARQIVPLLDGADLVLTDPPYGLMSTASRARPTNYQRARGAAAVEWDLEPFEGIEMLLEAAPDVCIWGGNYYRLPVSRGWLVWIKPDAPPSMATLEMAWTNSDRNARHIIHPIAATNAERVGHPTQKPLRVIKWSIGQFDGDGLILDPFMGSGTTLRAAADLGRRAIGIEINEDYCRIAVERLRQGVLL